MKRLILVACVLFLAGCGGGSGTPTPVADYAGNWYGNWDSEAWNGSSAVQQSGTVTLDITNTGATTGSFTIKGQSAPALTLTGQLAAGGTGTFTVTDTTTKTQYNGTGQLALPDATTIQGSIETTNSSGALWDFLDMGLNPKPATANGIIR